MNWIKKETKRANRYRAKLRAIIESKPYAFTQGVKKELEPKPYRTGRIKRIRGVLTYKITKEDWIEYFSYSKGFRDSYTLPKIHRNYYRQ